MGLKTPYVGSGEAGDSVTVLIVTHVEVVFLHGHDFPPGTVHTWTESYQWKFMVV